MLIINDLRMMLATGYQLFFSLVNIIYDKLEPFSPWNTHIYII